MTRKSAVKTLPRSTVILTVVLSFSLALTVQSTAQQIKANPEGNPPAVEVNLEAIFGNTLGSAPEDATQKSKRIVDGREVIILTPPSMQKKQKVKVQERQNVVLPRKKPAQTALAVGAPKETETVLDAQKEIAATAPIEAETKSPVDETKLAAIDIPKETQEAPATKANTPAPPTPKVEAIIEPAADNKPPLPSEEDVKATEKEIAETAAAKITDQTEEITVAAANPQKEIEDALTETAAANKTLEEGEILSLQYSAGEVDLSESGDQKIQEIYEQLDSDQRTVQLIAYATANNNSAARRLSLGRALAVRSKLLDLGMSNKKIEVRALGSPQGKVPTDRVDLVLIAR